MKKTVISLALALSAFFPARAATLRNGVGLQLYSLRDQFKASVPTALDEAQGFGCKVVETAGTYGLSAADFSAALAAHGLKAVSAHMGSDLLQKNMAGVIADAKALGVTYIVIPALGHKKPMDEAGALKAAANFNRWGQQLQAAGLKLAYHTHGYEFSPLGDGSGLTVFDKLVQATDPRFVCFEMDVFWTTRGGADPVTLLKRYPDRWKMLHLKDIRKGAPTGLLDGGAPHTDDVPVGSGQVDWARVLGTAQAIGVQYYFIEDESVAPLKNVPLSVEFLNGLKLAE
jgi:sugar phosphate isomerase/epimerase